MATKNYFLVAIVFIYFFNQTIDYSLSSASEIELLF